jgi:hypothetical protein
LSEERTKEREKQATYEMKKVLRSTEGKFERVRESVFEIARKVDENRH